jgi:DNA-binding transcriptional LysR family regulator
MNSLLGSINLNRLLVFAAVVEAGSLTAAAARLGLAKTMVSTHVQRLEAEVGASLIVRTTRRLSLTEAGEGFYQAVRLILRSTEDAVLAAGQGAAEPRGALRVTTPVDYGAAVIAPLLVRLRLRYPGLLVELISGDRRFDLIGEGMDVAIRLGGLADSSHQAVRIGSYAKWLVATPGFLAGCGALTSQDDLSRLPFVALSVVAQPLSVTLSGPRGEQRSVRFAPGYSANTAYARRAATLAGGGLAVLTDFASREDLAAGRLVRVLPDWSLPDAEIHAVFPAARHRPPQVRVFIDALRAQLAERA